jgi:arylsulfatase A-like enzyme
MNSPALRVRPPSHIDAGRGELASWNVTGAPSIAVMLYQISSNGTVKPGALNAERWRSRTRAGHRKASHPTRRPENHSRHFQKFPVMVSPGVRPLYALTGDPMPLVTAHPRLALVALLSLGLATACAESTPAAPPTARQEDALTAKPNLVVIMTDDLDVHTLKVMLDYGLMPHFQEHILGRSVRFANAFVTNSVCCPSRATFLTGQYSHNNGVLTNYAPNGAVSALQDGKTLATWLKAAGYRTGHVGKYLNGYGIQGENPQPGSHPAFDANYVPPGWDDWQGLVDLSTYRVFNYQVSDNGTVVSYGSDPLDYQTDVLALRARDFIEESEAQDATPFFLAVMPLAPHVESFPEDPTWADEQQDIWRWYIRPDPKDYTEKPQTMNTIAGIPLWPALKPSFNEEVFTDKPLWMQLSRPRLTTEDIAYLTRQYRSRLGSMVSLDDLIGTVAQTLQAKGELENTVLVFTSDNGFLYGEHRLAEKLAIYEESIRVPLYVRMPGMTAPSTVEALVLNNDLAPTLAALAGATPDLSVDGRSLVPFLQGMPPASWRKRFLVEHWGSGDLTFDIPTYFAVRTGPTALAAPDMVWTEYRGWDGSAFAWEQYDLRTDPLQLDSLHASTSPARVDQRATLQYWLNQLRPCANGSCQFHEAL